MIFALSLFRYLPGSDWNIMLRSSIKCLNSVLSPWNTLGGFRFGEVDRLGALAGTGTGPGMGVGAGAGLRAAIFCTNPYWNACW